MAHGPFRLGMEFEAAKILVQFCHFEQNLLNERSSLNSMLTSNGTYLGKVTCTKVVDNFDIFSVSIHTSPPNKWFRCYDRWKAEGAAEISFSGQINAN
jgi:hypothetical protein